MQACQEQLDTLHSVKVNIWMAKVVWLSNKTLKSYIFGEHSITNQSFSINQGVVFLYSPLEYKNFILFNVDIAISSKVCSTVVIVEGPEIQCICLSDHILFQC